MTLDPGLVPSRAGRLPWLLGLALLIVATSPGTLDSGDAGIRLETAIAWRAGEGGLIRNDPDAPRGPTRPDGRTYSFYSPLQTVLFLAPWELARHLAPGAPEAAAKLFYALSVPPVLVALLAALLASVLGAFGVAAGRARMLATLGILATPVWHYGRSGHDEILLAVAYALCLWGWSRSTTGNPRGWVALAAGAAMALATRWSSVPALAVLGLFALPDAERAVSGAPGRRALVTSGLILGVVTAALMAWNAGRFGSPFETGYQATFREHGTPMFRTSGLLQNIAALLVSPRRGLLVFCPAVLLVLVGGAAREVPRTLRTAAVLAFSVNAVFFASYAAWDGGFGWGPRFLVASLVLLAVALPGIGSGRLWALLVAVSIGFQVMSVVLPGSLEDFVAERARVADPGCCGPWNFSHSAPWLRPGEAARALANTWSNRRFAPLEDRAHPVATEVLASSDFNAVFWWPVRLAYRLHRWSPRAGLLSALALAALAVGLIVRGIRLAGGSQGGSGRLRRTPRVPEPAPGFTARV